MPPSSKSFHIGKVRGYLRGQIWYLSFFEQGRRRRPRVGPDRETARQLAAQINTQLEVGALTALSYHSFSNCYNLGPILLSKTGNPL
ncbi:MAG: hypothetical protein ACKO23_06460 [Gemmataceae bacterium]